MHVTIKKHAPAAILAAALLPALVACGDDSTATSAAGTSTSASPSTSSATAAALTVTDPWIKAADSGMTAAFGTLRNTGTKDITVVSASTAVDSTTELHEVVQNADGSMAMQPKQGGFVVPAGGSLTLEPGGNHIMLMGLERPLTAGEVVPYTLTLDDGSTVVVEATVKTFDGADEQYQGGSDDMGGMDMSGSSSGTDHSGHSGHAGHGS